MKWQSLWDDRSLTPLNSVEEQLSSDGSLQTGAYADGYQIALMDIPPAARETGSRSSMSSANTANVADENSAVTIEQRQASEDSDDTLHNGLLQQANSKMSALSTRGKGAYNCPLGTKCRKGGVHSSGELVVFERNCAFRLDVSILQ